MFDAKTNDILTGDIWPDSYDRDVWFIYLLSILEKKPIRAKGKTASDAPTL